MKRKFTLSILLLWLFVFPCILFAQTELTIVDWNSIANVLFVVISLIFPSSAAAILSFKKAKDELIEVIKEAPIENKIVLQTAIRAGKKKAEKILNNIVD